MGRRLALALVIGASVAACDDAPAVLETATTATTATTPTAPEPEQPHGGAERALAYQPGATPTDVEIGERQQAVRNAPENVDAYLALAAIFVRKAREAQDPSVYRLAEDAVRAALSREPANVNALAIHAHILSQDHRFEEARVIAHRIVRAKPDDTTARIVLGDAELELGNYEAAVEMYQSAIDLRPDLRSYNRGAYMRWLHGDYEGALDLYRLAAESGDLRDPETVAWCHTDLGEVEWTQGHLDRAKMAADAALQLHPSYAPALRLKARAMFAEGQTDDAIRYIEDAINARALPEDHLQLSEWLEARGDAERAREERERGLALVREDRRAVSIFLARHDQERDRALELARQEVRDRPTIQSYDALALALTRSGRLSDARTAMDRAMHLGTADPRFFLHDALLRVSSGDREGALRSLGRANALNPHIDPRLASEIASTLAVAPDYVPTTEAANPPAARDEALAGR